MINKVGYGNNRTSFGSYFVLDKNGFLDKLYNVTSDIVRTSEFAKELRYKTPNHVLEIISLSEGTVQRAIVRNNSTGAWASFETNNGLSEMLPCMLRGLNNMAKKNVAFWSEDSKSAKLFRLLTGQKDNSAVKI